MTDPIERWIGELGGQKNREARFGPASNRLAETFSLIRSLSSPQQPCAIALHSTNNLGLVNPRKLANGRAVEATRIDDK
jgi:hypothetical protein